MRKRKLRLVNPQKQTDMIATPIEVDLTPYIGKGPKCPHCGQRLWMTWADGHDIGCTVDAEQDWNHPIVLASDVALPYRAVRGDVYLNSRRGNCDGYAAGAIDECTHCGATFTISGMPLADDQPINIAW